MKPNPKHYWLYSDGKTVREVSPDEFHDMIVADFRSRSDSHLLVKVFDTEIYIHKGKDSVWVRRSQLDQILKNGGE